MTDQPQPRARTRIGATAPAQNQGGRVPNNAAPNDTSWMHSGEAAAQHRARELAEAQRRREQGFAPFRYWLPVGAAGDVVILDNNPGFCIYEHRLPGPGGDQSKPVFEPCPKEFDSCPLCQQHGDSYYVMFLTVMDLRPFTKRDGTEVQHSRKLMAIKVQQQPFFVRQFERHGNLRGVHLLMTRDSQQSFANGQPEFVALHTEEDILASFSHPQVTGQDGRVIKQANEDCFPFDYAKLFKRPSGDDLRRRYGGVAPAGSRAEAEAEWGGNDPATTQPAQPAQPAQGAGIQPSAGATQPAQPAQPVQPAQPAPAQGGGITRAAPNTAPAQAGAGVDPDDEIPF